jgi:hypothetical protein
MFVHSRNKHLNHKNRITTDLVFVTSDLYAEEEEEEEEEDGFACRAMAKKRDLEMVLLLLHVSTCQHFVHPGLSARVMWSCQQT